MRPKAKRRNSHLGDAKLSRWLGHWGTRRARTCCRPSALPVPRPCEASSIWLAADVYGAPLRAIARAPAEPAVLRVRALVEFLRVVRLSTAFSVSISSASWAPFVAPYA
jgi:hypothetical protein